MKVYEGKRICPPGKHAVAICRITLITPALIRYRCLECDAEWEASC